MRIEKVDRFDDVDYDAGYEYRGFNYLILDGVDEFLVRTYDDQPGGAMVLHPTDMAASTRLRTLVGFLQTELEATAIYLYKGEIGSYVQVDLESLQFC
ncbi:hypothetical protein [Pseudomonas siliginis]|uniref:hypothetical protein n=1 Tax=Pseudomonas siliginis TaxID=2842346 RepID=UPI002093408E|nr:hypothetical protein [Pseudomonas siliginis]UST81883.1 hypothetical protein NF676_11335 [Pseudomonas siliginis]USU02716.1 hypothetical protein NF680_10735 [Pseudomonas siliginis]